MYVATIAVNVYLVDDYATFSRSVAFLYVVVGHDI